MFSPAYKLTQTFCKSVPHEQNNYFVQFSFHFSIISSYSQILSNGKYKAVFHRSTVNKNETRMSWPVFLEPPPEHEVGPIPKLINEENPAKYKTKKYKDYAYCKLNKLPQ